MRDRRPYSATDDAFVRRYAAIPGGLPTAAKLTGRTLSSIISRCQRINVKRTGPDRGDYVETKAITERDDRIMTVYGHICRHPGVTVRDIADATGIPFAEVRADVDHLLKPTYSGSTRYRNAHGEPLVVNDGGGLRQNLIGNSHSETEPAKILTLSVGYEGGRVNKRRPLK